MVNVFPSWLLTHTKIDPKKIAEAYGVTEQACWDYINELSVALNETEKKYREGAEARRMELDAFVEEIPDKKETKRKLLLERLYKAKSQNRSKEATRLIAESKAFLASTPTISQENVLRAKQTPITTLLQVSRVGNISCPFHEDKTPSFQIKKNNTFTCYSCGAYGDVIDLYQKIHRCDFITAVKALQ